MSFPTALQTAETTEPGIHLFPQTYIEGVLSHISHVPTDLLLSRVD